MDSEHDNGNVVRGLDGGTQRVTITCKPGTQRIGLDLDCLSLDVALSLLERAHRELEARFRFKRTQELIAEAIANKQISAVAGEVMRRGPRGV